ncbi:MAG: TonB-dependent receptor, partial [Bacteroidota bacterium]
QVDGMERTDKLNNKTYTPTNSATVEEIQILKGGFNAEYGNLRSGMFNVVTKKGGPRFSGSADYRMSPGHQKHFGPNAFGADQYDRKIYAGANSFNEVTDIEDNTIFMGWNAITDTRNAEAYMGKSDWTPQQLQQVWEHQHRPIEYTDAPDHYLDLGISGPIGLENSGFLVGVKYNRILPVFPTVRGYDQVLSFEGKLNFQLAKSMNLMVSGLYGETGTSTNGDDWGSQGIMDYGFDINDANDNPAVNSNSKYYLAYNNLLDVTTSQAGLRFTHTLSPSTFYEVKYNYFTTDSKTSLADARNSAGVTTIGGVQFDEGPIGWVHGSESLQDVTGTYAFSGGGRIEDISSVKSHRINFDMTSQVTKEHMLKFGLLYSTDHVVKDNYKAGSIILDPDAGDFVNFDESPYQIAGYVQDKIEYGGLIANIGLRVEHFAGNGVIYDPSNPYSLLWARGGTAGYESPDALPQEESKSYTFLAPRISFSHPVHEFTKFFFNFGVYYSEPTTLDRYGLYSESWAFGNPQGDIRRMGYPNLEPAKTSAYEVGFEQAIGSDWLVRTYFYSKDNSQQIGTIRVDGLSGSHANGDFRNYEGVGKGAAGYTTQRNNQYQSIRGIEMKITKRMGRFFTGWVNMNYMISTSGYYGVKNYNQDPLVSYLNYAATKDQPQTAPSFIANLNFHTPSDWAPLIRDWSLSINQFWNSGAKFIYNPTNLPTREVRSIYYWVDNYQTNLRLSKLIKLTDFLKIRLYLDVRNVFDFEALNFNVLDSREKESYFTQYVDSESGLGRDIGEVEDDNGNNVFTENWVDKDGQNRAPIAPSKDFALALNPRSILLGIKIEF